MTELARTKEALDLAIGELSKKARHLYPDGVTCEEACHRTLLAINAVLHPAPIMEEVEEVVGWVNVYQHESGEIACGTVYTDKLQADRIASGRTDFLSCQPVKVTVQREKKAPVERSAPIFFDDFGTAMAPGGGPL